MDNFMTKKLRKNQQVEKNRRYVAMCAVDFRPFSMINIPAFCWYLGGFSPAYMEKEMHKTTLEGHLSSLSADMRAAMTARLAEQYDSAQALARNGPWISIQCDATRTNNIEYYTVSFPWVPPDFSGMERVAFCTKELPGRNGAAEIEPWLRQVRVYVFYFYAAIFH